MLAELGIMRRVTGDLTEAVDAFSQALEIYRATGDRHGEADALTELGRVLSHDRGSDRGRRRPRPGPGVLPRDRSPPWRSLRSDQPRRRAATDRGSGRGRRRRSARALEIYRTIGYGQGEAEALANLGIVRRLTGDLAGAATPRPRALDIYRKIGSRHDEAWALNHYAATIAARGDLPCALALYQQALTMNRELNKPDGQALALEGLGECRLTAGETETGAADLRQALKIYQRLGMAPDAERVRGRLGLVR